MIKALENELCIATLREPGMFRLEEKIMEEQGNY